MKKIRNSFVKICALSASALLLTSCAVYASDSKPMQPHISDALNDLESTPAESPDISVLTEIYPALQDADVDYIRMKNVDSKELLELDYSDCTIAVLDRWGVKVVGYLSSDAVSEFIDCLNDAEIEHSGCEKMPKKTGAAFTYQITLKTGEQIYIDTAETEDGENEENYILINGKSAYGCDRESAVRIESYYKTLAEGLCSEK